MNSRAADRLFHALLIELVSESYAEGQRFWSHRKIMRHWRVAATTASEGLGMLCEQGLLAAKDRSGHYLAAGFRERALLLLDQADGTEPAMPRRADLRSRILATEEGLRRVAVVLIVPDLPPSFRLKADGPPAEYDRGSTLTVRGIFDEARRAGCQVDFHLHNGTPEAEERMLKRLIGTHPDGVIFVRRLMHYDLTRLTDALRTRLVPVATIYNEGGVAGTVSVNFNNVGMGYHAADLFIRRGLNALGIIVPPDPVQSVRDRVRGFRLRAEEAGLSVREFTMSETAVGEAEVGAVLASGVTAVFSIGHEVLQALGKIPAFADRVRLGELSVVSCSSLNKIEGVQLPVDVMFMDFESLGRSAFGMLDSYLRGRALPKSYLHHSVHAGARVGFAADPRGSGQPAASVGGR